MEELLRQYHIKIDLTRAMLTVALVMTRTLTIVQVAPFLGGKQAPPEIKMGVAIAFTITLLPVVTRFQTGPLPIDPVTFTVLVLKEAFIGMLIGFIAAELFYAVDVAGRLVDLFRGTNQVQLMVPQLGERSSAFGDLNYQLLLMIFVGIGGHHVFIAAIFESFRIVPIDTWPRLSAGYWPIVEMFARLTANVFTIGATLSAPVCIACLVTELTFGILNRTAPQINAYFMAMPAKVFVGGLLYLAAFPALVEMLVGHSAGVIRYMKTIFILLG